MRSIGFSITAWAHRTYWMQGWLAVPKWLPLARSKGSDLMSIKRLFDSVSQDLRYALRTMRKQPGFAVTTILTLAFAIGANTAIFTVVRAVLLRPLHYSDPDRLVQITGSATPIDRKSV